MKTSIHPHALVADFVNRYDSIKSFLEKGDVETVRPALGEMCMRAALTHDDIFGSSANGVYPRYKMATDYLSSLFQAKDIGERVVQDITLCADRYIAEVELILSSDENYKAARSVENE